MKLPTLLLGLLVVAGCTSRSMPPVEGGPSNGHYLNPLTGKAWNSGLTDRDKADAKAIDGIQTLFNDGLFDKARTALDELLAAGCHHPQALFLRAKLANQAGDLKATVAWCEKTLQESSGWGEPRVLLAKTFLKLERPAAAGSVFADLDRMAPKSPWGPWGLGQVAIHEGNFAVAIKHFDLALERDPDHLPSLETRADLAAQAGDRAGESRFLVRLVVLAPEAPGLHRRIGELAEEDGRLEDARRSFERAFELEPRPETAKRLASLAERRGDQPAARRWRQRAGEAAPVDETPPELR